MRGALCAYKRFRPGENLGAGATQSPRALKMPLGDPRRLRPPGEAGAPSFVTQAQLDELNIVCTKKEDE